MAFGTTHSSNATASVRRTRGPTGPDGATLNRIYMIDTGEETAQEIEVESFIAANIPHLDTENVVKDDVYHGVGTDITAEKGERGLTSQHMSAMQDKALTGNFGLLKNEEMKPSAGDSEEEDEDGEEEAERVMMTAPKMRKDSAAARGGTIKDESEEEDEEEDGGVTLPAKANINPPRKTSSSSGSKVEGKRFDLAYVEAHPNEDFRHTGRGWWARGLLWPGDPGYNLKCGVRGPGAAAWKAANTGKKK